MNYLKTQSIWNKKGKQCTQVLSGVTVTNHRHKMQIDGGMESPTRKGRINKQPRVFITPLCETEEKNSIHKLLVEYKKIFLQNFKWQKFPYIDFLILCNKQTFKTKTFRIIGNVEINVNNRTYDISHSKT